MTCDLCDSFIARDPACVLGTKDVVTSKDCWKLYLKSLIADKVVSLEIIQESLAGLLSQMASSDTPWALCENCKRCLTGSGLPLYLTLKDLSPRGHALCRTLEPMVYEVLDDDGMAKALKAASAAAREVCSSYGLTGHRTTDDCENPEGPNRGRRSAVISPQIMFNLWYVHGGDGLIYSLRARAYVCSGDDEEDLSVLRRVALTDYLIARPFPIPEAFHIKETVIEKMDDVDKALPVAHISAVTEGAVALGAVCSTITIFEDAMKQLEKDFPSQSGLTVPENPLVCITPLVGDEDGNIKPEFTSKRRL